jgi:diguanylate cyclase (GGDEF)-like protein
MRTSWWSTILVALATAACVSLIVLSGSTWRADGWFYDFALSRRDTRVDDRILVVVIDDKSLSALGRWPWQRRIHADLLDRLGHAGPRGIAYDVMFSEPDHDDPQDDRALADAIARNGRVVLPVMVERGEPAGMPIEVLPMPSMVQGAMALGHVAVNADPDGVARSAYLRAGLGEPHWPAMAAALYRTAARDGADTPLPGLRNPRRGSGSPYLWNRDNRVLVPYASVGAFQQVSFIDVMRGEVPDTLIHDRLLLVGVTAKGVGDSIPTPGAGADSRMPGVLYQANLLNMLLTGDALLPLSVSRQLPVSILAVLVPVLLLLRYRSRRAWLIVAGAMLAIVLASALLLNFGGYWFPPMAALAGLLLAFVLLAFQQLRSSHRLAHSDALTRLANRRLFDIVLARELAASRRTGRPLSLLLIDVDHFKHYNDRYGHQAGDEMLCQVAQAVARHIGRPRDLAARYGGDELAAILPETSARNAHALADAIVHDVASMAIPHAESRVAGYVTVSVGVAAGDPKRPADDTALLNRADAALYRAKELGRNRSYCAPAVDA